MKRFTVIAAVLFLTAACTENSTRSSEHDGFHYSFSVEAIKNSNLSKSDAAEEIAKGAEQLLHAKGFEQASKVAGEALKLDPKNFRAGFIKALLTPLLLQKGIAARLQPLMERNPQMKRSWEEEVAELKAQPDVGFNSYYLDGSPDIATEKQLQHHIDLEIAALEKFRVFLRDHRDSEIVMISSPLFVRDANARYAAACKITETADRSYELVCPPSITRHQVSLNRADFESLQYGLIFYEFYLGYPNSYELSGSLDTIRGMDKILPSDLQRLADNLMARAEFGSLRLPNTLAKARGWALDLLNGLNWAMENPQLTCPKGTEDASNRPGYYFNKGLCVASYYKSILITAEKAVKTRGPVPIDYVRNDKTVKVQQNFFAPFERPLASLKQFGTLKFNKCGDLTNFGDTSLAGVFPNRDALTYVLSEPKCE